MLDQFKWESVQEKVARELAAQLFPELKPEDLDRVSWSAFSAQLPFYGAHRLYRLIGMLPETNPPRRHECYALWDEVHEPFLINGESTTIHRANEAAPLVLRPEHFPDYIRFFMFGLLGGEGPFILVESPPDFSVPGSDVVASNAKALTFEGHDEIGRALYKAVVFYNGALFVATLAVDSKGDVEMVSDEPLADDIPREAVPQAPDFWSEIALLDFFRPITAAMIASARNSAPATGGSTPSNNPALVILTELLLERALARQGQNRLITHFNALQKGGSAIDQFATLILAAAPIIAVETNQPFVEEVIGQIVRERSNTQNSLPVFSGPEPKVPNGSPALVLVAFQSYPLIPETDRLAHDLSTRDVAAIITCAAFAQVPESLRVITDIVLRLPSMDADIFEKLFEQVMGAPVPANWRQQGDAWSRFVLHTDFEHPRRMQLAPDKAFDYIRGQVTDRMTAVDPVQGLGLKQLHGLGEARQFAEDLIADIHAAIQGQIPWTQVDRGALLVGPPGTGKTTLAKAIAKDCKVKFVQGSATAWQSAGHLAEHIMAIRKTFAEARRYAPSILFIDEIDSLGNREQFSGQNASYNTDVVNAVLEQIQGLDTEAPIFVLGATN
ncbi:MAG: AAA family ATPase, partial [Alphaproteobacteria bacterium]|nr:AAA family ATPase [Alphaproteobacteria bacterium]